MNVCENSKLPSSFPVVLNKIHREAGIAIESTCFFVRLTSFLLSWLLLTLSHSGLTAIDFSSLLSYSGITGTGVPEFNRMEAFYVSARKRISGGCLFLLPKNR